MGPEAMMKYINPDEAIKRLAAAQGIDVLNLVKSVDQQQQEMQQNMQMQQGMELTKQAGQMMSSPIADPTKNPNASEVINNAIGYEAVPPTEGGGQEAPGGEPGTEG
jgi:hypothetical protein